LTKIEKEVERLRSQANVDDGPDGEEEENSMEGEGGPEEDGPEGIQEEEAESAGIEMELL
jgi:hypothetical protein